MINKQNQANSSIVTNFFAAELQRCLGMLCFLGERSKDLLALPQWEQQNWQWLGPLKWTTPHRPENAGLTTVIGVLLCFKTDL